VVKPKTTPHRDVGRFTLEFQKKHLVEVGFSVGADGGTLNPAEQARQQAAIRSRWSLQKEILLVILRLEAVSHINHYLQNKTHP
jgi:hypothetical protein